MSAIWFDVRLRAWFEAARFKPPCAQRTTHNALLLAEGTRRHGCRHGRWQARRASTCSELLERRRCCGSGPEQTSAEGALGGPTCGRDNKGQARHQPRAKDAAKARHPTIPVTPRLVDAAPKTTFEIETLTQVLRVEGCEGRSCPFVARAALSSSLLSAHRASTPPQHHHAFP
jgi:hypothetical protein